MKEIPYQNYKRLTPKQMPTVRHLTKQCCNYDYGECLMLDDGAGCPCVQGISHSLLCKWFRKAVLPLDPVLELSLCGAKSKPCCLCKQPFIPGSNRAQFCPVCREKRRREKEAERQRRRYASVLRI